MSPGPVGRRKGVASSLVRDSPTSSTKGNRGLFIKNTNRVLWSPSLLLANTEDNKIGKFHAKSQGKEGMPPVGRRGGLPPLFSPPPSPPPVAQSTGDASHPPPPPPELEEVDGQSFSTLLDGRGGGRRRRGKRGPYFTVPRIRNGDIGKTSTREEIGARPWTK